MSWVEIAEKLELLQTRVDKMSSEFKTYRREHKETLDVIVKAQEANTLALNELIVSTKGVVELYTAAEGAVRFGGMMGKFFRWLTGLAVIGTAFAWFFDLIKVKF